MEYIYLVSSLQFRLPIRQRSTESQVQILQKYKGLLTALIVSGFPMEEVEAINAKLPRKASPQKAETEEAEWRRRHVDANSTARLFAGAKPLVPESKMASNWRFNAQSTILPDPNAESQTVDEPSTMAYPQQDDELLEAEEEGEPRDQAGHQDRSLTFRGFPPSKILAEILSLVEKGQILNAYKHTHSAHISFVDPVAAEKFLTYSRQARLYIRDQQVSLRLLSSNNFY